METDVISYIKEAQKHGLSNLEIKQNLLNAGWEAQTVEESFAFVKAAENKPVYNKDEDLKIKVQEEKAGLQALTGAKPIVQPLQPVIQKQPASQTVIQVQPTLSEQHFQEPAKKSLLKRAGFWVTLFLLAAIGAGGYYAYAYVYNNPAKVWEKFILGNKGKIYEAGFNVSYADTVQPTTADAQGTGTPTSFKLYLNGSAYMDNTDQNNAKSKADFTIGIDSSGTNFSKNFKYAYFNNNLFVYLGQLPLLGSLTGSKQYDWYKLDLIKLNDAIKTAGANNTTVDQKALIDELKARLQAIWENSNLIKMEKYLGKEQLNGINTYHFSNSVDKGKLKSNLEQSIDAFVEISKKVPEYSNEIKDNDIKLIKDQISTMLDKYQVKEFETWIGTKDFRLYKMHFVSNAPSFNSYSGSSLGLSSLTSATRAKNRDAQRLDDIKQMASALELYYNDFGGYPEGKDGQPYDIAYSGPLLNAPQPADGLCTDWYNTYWYTPTGQKKVVNSRTVYDSYEMTFCLGNETGGYAAGIAKLTPSGIRANIPCPTGDGHCINSNPVQNNDQAAQVSVDNLDFGAEFKLDINYSNYGKTQNIEAPTDYFDLMQLASSTPL